METGTSYKLLFISTDNHVQNNLREIKEASKKL